VLDQGVVLQVQEDVAVAGDGFEQMVGLAGAAPAVVDFGFEVLPPGFAAGAGFGAVFCCVCDGCRDRF
jgi:hypothetical protein